MCRCKVMHLKHNSFYSTFSGVPIPSGEESSILPPPIANHSAGFGSSCPLAKLKYSLLVFVGALLRAKLGSEDNSGWRPNLKLTYNLLRMVRNVLLNFPKVCTLFVLITISSQF